MANATLRYQEFRSSGVQEFRRKKEERRKKKEERNFSPTPPTPQLRVKS
jgi:hypothetical protein